jgi:hypothetical protein
LRPAILYTARSENETISKHTAMMTVEAGYPDALALEFNGKLLVVKMNGKAFLQSPYREDDSRHLWSRLYEQMDIRVASFCPALLPHSKDILAPIRHPGLNSRDQSFGRCSFINGFSSMRMRSFGPCSS